MSYILLSITATVCYLLAFTAKGINLKHPVERSYFLALGLVIAGLLAHGYLLFDQVVQSDHMLNFSFFIDASVIAWLIVAINTLTSLIRKSQQNLLVFILPIAIISVLSSLIISTHYKQQNILNKGLVTHIIFSTIAYGLISLACIQSLLLAFQEKQLKSHHPNRLLAWLPAIDSMEEALFSLIAAGWSLLSIAMLIGWFYVDNVFEQQLAHKLVFSAIAWLVFLILLIGRHFRGWRGKTATRWTLIGTLALMLGFFGSKFVIEFLL